MKRCGRQNLLLLSANIAFLFMKHRYLLILLIFISNACLPTRQVQFESVFTPESSLLAGEGDILVCNLSYYPESDKSDGNDLRRLAPEEQEILDTMINHSIFDGLFSVFMDSPKKTLREASYFESRTKDTTGFLQPLSNESVHTLCKQNNVSYLIVFEYYSFATSLSWSYTFSYDGYLATQELRRKLLWRIYDSEKGLINEEIQSDTLYIERSAESVDYATQRLPLITDLIKEVYWDAGAEYAKKVSPYWDVITRNYYAIYNKEGVDISQNAGELIKVASESKKKYRTYMAYYNLAVLDEKSGETGKAKEHIIKALHLRPNSSYAAYYLNQLKQRDKDINTIMTITQE